MGVETFALIESGRTWAFTDLPRGHAGVVDVSQVGVAGTLDAVLSGEAWLVRDLNGEPVPKVRRSKSPRIGLQTSGTTGRPKWVVTTLDKLGKKLKPGAEPAIWLLTFNPGSFAGLQVILSAFIGGHTLVAPSFGASVAEMADLAVAHRVTHISGTPTFWRAFLMTLGDRHLDLRSATLGGEAADQAILDAVATRFPNVALRHIYATTELGRIFSVSDGRAGFPRSKLKGRLGVSENSTLTVGGVDTGDVVELTEDRVLFKGRLDAMVNVGGVKVNPESVEAHILSVADVQDVRVSGQPNPLTGHILVADIVLKPDVTRDSAEAQIRAHINALPRAHRPARLRFVEALDIGATGKKLRSQ